jgi:hypothetical protein
MRVRPIPPLHHPRRRRFGKDSRPFILRSELGATILGMISTHSLSAFTPAATVERSGPARPPRDAGGPAPAQAVDLAAAAQRPLEAVPAQPARPLPRGSLLGLRV